MKSDSVHKKSYENKTILDLFYEQVKKNPLSEAVVFENEKLTFQQLDEQSNQLAHYLQLKGVKEEMFVPL